MLPSEQVALADALGRILSCDVVSDVDLPPVDMSVMDGFCLHSASTRGASGSRPVRLRVLGTLRAGEVARARVGPGECMAIMTGAALPPGTDAVVSTEEVGGEVDGEVGGTVCIRAEVEPGRWVRARAEIISRGHPVQLRGKRATCQVLGLLASLGVDPVAVARKPLVGIIATGDELVAVTASPGRVTVRASNLPMLLGLARAAGCEVVDGGISGDDEASIAAGVERCRGCDAVVVSGGASGGKFDLVAKVLVDIGVQPAFREVRMGPGKRTLFGVRDGVAFFSLPGTPAAALTVFHLIVRPGLLAMMGASSSRGRLLRARLACPLRGPAGLALSSGFTRVVAARWVGDVPGDVPGGVPGGLPGRVQPVATRGGGDVLALSDAACFIVLGEDAASVEVGDEVDVLVPEGE